MMPIAAAFILYIGTYLNPNDVPAGGIYSVRFDAATGEFSQVQLEGATPHPTFLALHPNGKFLYATTNSDGYSGPAPEAFAIAPGSGRLQPLPGRMAAGLPLVHAVVDPTGRALMAVSYFANRILSFPLGADGSPGAPASVISNSGATGPVRDRQDKPHPHSVTLSPDGRRLYVCDLGLDRIYGFALDPATARLTPARPAFTATYPGAGPRHSKFSADGRFLYVINELGGSISVFACDPATGALSPVQTAPTLPDDFKGLNTSAEIRIHPSGRFVYGSNRGHDSLAVFARDGASGRLTRIEIVPCGGNHPRNFALSPDGGWLVCANRDSSNLVAFRVDPGTGRLTRWGKPASVPKPTCVLFVPAG